MVYDISSLYSRLYLGGGEGGGYSGYGMFLYRILMFCSQLKTEVEELPEV